MRSLALAAAALLLAGCSDPGGGDASSSQTSSSAGDFTTAPPTTTASGLPFVTLDDMDLRLTLQADGRVHRVRLVVFDDVSIDSVGVPDEDGGGGGGPGGGGEQGPDDFGIAVFPQDGSPLTMQACSDAMDDGAYDARTHNGDADIPLAAGLYDLWAWSSTSTTLVLEVDGGGDPFNLTAQAHNWTSTASQPTVTKSGPAQATAQMSESVAVAEAALVLARFSAPNGYPEEQATLDISSGGSCATGAAPGAGGGGGGGGGFGGPSLSAAAYVGPGDATVEASFTATLSPLGEPSAAIVVLQPL